MACQTLLNLSDTETRQYRFSENTTEKNKCFAKCLFNKLEIFNETNGFNVERSVKLFRAADNIYSEDLTRYKVEKCADRNLQNNDACKWAHRGFRCFVKENLDFA